MKKIVVTTDFSANSASALAFVAQLASQTPVEITFLYVQHLLHPTSRESWGDASFTEYQQAETEKALQELKDFVGKTYQTMAGKIDVASCHFAVADDFYTEKAIRDYAAENEIDYICISTRGAGTLKKMVGTTTSALIKNSEIPIISVPAHYEVKPIAHILYASDLKKLEPELQQVVDFAKPLEAQVELLHFNSLAESLDSEEVQATVQKFSDYNVQVKVENTDYVKALIAHIKDAIHSSQTSMLVMFTEQNRSFFQKIFVSSKAADYSFDAPVPLLTFKK